MKAKDDSEDPMKDMMDNSKGCREPKYGSKDSGKANDSGKAIDSSLVKHGGLREGHDLVLSKEGLQEGH